MSHRKGAALLAASALLACAGLVNAAEPANIPGPALTLDRPLYLQSSSQQKPSDWSLMGLADRTGLKLGDSGVSIGGWAEVSWTYNFDTPAGGINVGRSFADFEDQDPTLNQIVLFVDKGVDTSKFDVGGRIEFMWGADARGIHTNGLFDHYGFNDGPNNQFDLTQAYLDVSFGGGFKVRAGKFVTTIGYEYINPNQNALFSRSFGFNFGIPFVQAGILAYYDVNERLQVYGGVTRGWEQSTEDNNDAIDGLFGISFKINDKTTLLLNGSVGPQLTDNNEDYRYLIEGTISTKLSDQLSFALNALYGYDEAGATDGDSASWYGAAAYLSYTVSDRVGVNFRGEYFNDDDGARGLGTTVYEVTLGLDLKPLASDRNFGSLRIRPEVRWDFAQDDIFDGGQDDNQLTFGVDAIIGF
jgi:hypothetical protein